MLFGLLVAFKFIGQCRAYVLIQWLYANLLNITRLQLGQSEQSIEVGHVTSNEPNWEINKQRMSIHNSWLATMELIGDESSEAV